MKSTIKLTLIFIFFVIVTISFVGCSSNKQIRPELKEMTVWYDKPAENVWLNGVVTGLKARGGFVVNMEWKDGKLTSAEIKSLLGNPCVIRYGDKIKNYNIETGKSISITDLI